jgi:F-type H+-transporting ATPase subunit alpha
VAIIYAGTQGFLDDIPVEKIKEFEIEFHKFLKVEGREVLYEIQKMGELSEKNEEKLKKLINEFKAGFNK